MMESAYLECLRWAYALTPDAIGILCANVLLVSVTAGVVVSVAVVLWGTLRA